MTVPSCDVEVLLPVHNEGESIESTVREIFAELSREVRVSFIICEDGSTDTTKDVLRNLAQSVPVNLIMSDQRKGYSRAVNEGMAALRAEYLLCLDSDGQCDPRDFWQFWRQRKDFDVLVGWRTGRADTWIRKGMSRLFYHVYQGIFRTPLHDPSCPFVLVPRRVLDRLLPELGEMQQGFWWEFTARVFRRGYSIKELPVHHRLRAAGKTQVYQLAGLPGIGYRHFLALFRIWSQTRRPVNAEPKTDSLT